MESTKSATPKCSLRILIEIPSLRAKSLARIAGKVHILRSPERGRHDRFRFIESYRHRPQQVDAEFDRSVRAFGGAIQSAISKLRFAIVGNGGTGSAVAEQLVRLGARDLILFNPDSLETSNLTRVYGSTRVDVGCLRWRC